jgi:hypothetical protein
MIEPTKLTSSVTGLGGGGNVDLSTFRSLARRAPLVDLAFFPMMMMIFQKQKIIEKKDDVTRIEG